MQYKTLPRWGGQGKKKKNAMQYKTCPAGAGRVTKQKTLMVFLCAFIVTFMLLLTWTCIYKHDCMWTWNILTKL